MLNHYGGLIDFYEISMLDTLIRERRHEDPAVFQMFTRKLPKNRGYGVYAGLGRFVEAVKNFKFTEEELVLLEKLGVSDETLEYLENFTFKGSIFSYREGDFYFPQSPVLQVEGTLGEGLLLETVALSIVNHDSAVASAAARMRTAAGEKTLIEMGGRRTHESAAVASARAAYIAGFDATSNVRAGVLYGIPVRGTAAHAFTLAHETEVEAFSSQVKNWGRDTTLLVDTYNIVQGTMNALKVAGVELGGVRVDSGDLFEEVSKVRKLLDENGAYGTKIVATSDLDEYIIAKLTHAPVDSYGVGTQLVTGSGHPTAHFVYKLVQIGDPARLVEKTSAGKRSVGGKKVPYRTFNGDGFVTGEFYTTRDGDGLPPMNEKLYTSIDTETFVNGAKGTLEARNHHARVKQTLPPHLLNLNFNGKTLDAKVSPF